MKEATTTRVWICQCICPQRHCIMATAGEAADEGEAKVKIEAPLANHIRIEVGAGFVNPWCGICGARSEAWRYEVRATRFRTMAEAMPELQKAEADQAIARSVLAKKA